MRTPRSPFGGYLPDKDQLVYWAGAGQTALPEYLIPSEMQFSSLDHTLHSQMPALGKGPQPVLSLFNPSGASGALQFSAASQHWMATDDISQDNFNFQTLATTWSVAFWYDLSSAATQTVMEYSVNNSPGSLSQMLGLSVQWLGQQNRFVLRRENGSGTYEVFSPTVPAAGWIGVTKGDAGTNATSEFRWYSSSVKGELLGTTNIQAKNTLVAGTSSARWMLGASVRYGTSYSTPAFYLDGKIGEIAVWRGTNTPEKMQALYGSCLQTWDDDTLMKSGNGQAHYRVMIEDASSVFQDMTALDGRDWVTSVDITEAVDSPTSTAKVSLRRRFARFADLSPINTEIPYASLVGLRRRIKIQRAITPMLWKMQGWEWKNRWEGLIDDWSMSDNTIDLACSDKAAALNDTFIMDTKIYEYAPSPAQLETHLQDVIDDFEPKLVTDDDVVTTIGYRGGKPKVFSEAGSTYCPTFSPIAFAIRYADAASGPVMGELQTAVDQIGADIRYLNHEPSESWRLTAYNPKRDFYLPLKAATGGANPRITAQVPHGLSLGVPVGYSGTASHNFTGSVASIISPYAFTVGDLTSLTPVSGTISGGSLYFSYTASLQASDIRSIEPAQSNVKDIRNQVRVRFNRTTTTSTTSVIKTAVDADGHFVVTLSKRIPQLDPDNLGFVYQVSGYTPGGSGGTLFNHKATGTLGAGGLTITSFEVAPGLSPGDFISQAVHGQHGTFSSEHQAFEEVLSTSTPSVYQYGLLPVGVYEGSNLAISTDTEAGTLAQSILDDLAQPTVDLTMRTRPLPLGLNDIVQLPIAPKGQWNTVRVAAIVSVRESCQSGACSVEYGLRNLKPTKGVAWTQRIRNNGLRPVPPPRHRAPVTTISPDIVMEGIGSGIRFHNRFKANGPSHLREHQTEMWVSTEQDFRPTAENRIGPFSGNRVEFSGGGDGLGLTPGTTYYVRYAFRDIFGNLSEISGLSSATTGDLSPVVPRFLDRTAAAMAAQTQSTTTWNDSAYTPIKYMADDGSDTLGKTFDTFGNFSLTSSLFRCPTDGTYVVNSRQAWERLAAKSGDSVVGRIEHFPGTMATCFATYSTTSVLFPSGTATTQVVFIPLTAQIYCSSGDFLRVAWENHSDAMTVLATTQSASFSYVSYALLSQR